MRLLFIAMPDSVHAARWINQVTREGWDVRLFPAQPDPVHPGLKNATVYGLSCLRQKGSDPSIRFRGRLPLRTSGNRLEWLVHRYRPRWEVAALARAIRAFKPDIVHSLEFQHAGYITLAAREALGGRFPTWAVTNWGSDIYLFGRFAEHQDRIRDILRCCDYYAAECQRDVSLALEMGLQGEVLPVLPNGGGYDLAQAAGLRQPGAPSARRVIAIKGYQGWAGRALFGLRALAVCADALRDYRVVVYSASDDVRLAAELLGQSAGMPVSILDRVHHEDILRLHGQARISIGLSISDAISTSLLEALVMGSFPIQSRTSCADEWIECGRTGFLVDPEDPQGIADSIRRAIADDALVDRAAELNRETAARLDDAKIQPQVVAMYEGIAEKGSAKTPAPNRRL